MSIPSIEKFSLTTNSVSDETFEAGTEKPGEERTTLYPKIHKFTDFLYHARRLNPRVESLDLTGTVKLHGTHADIVFERKSNDIRLQSRNQLALSPEKDNAGFAAFIAATEKKTLLNLRDRVIKSYRDLNPTEDVTGDIVIAGEWCGAGVQKKVAISEIPKFFVIISININDSWLPDWQYADISEESARIFHTGKAGFFSHELNMNDVAASEAKIKALTDAVEKECPFAKALGISGLGEGIVWKATKHYNHQSFWFKSKGDLLEVSKSSKLPASAVDKTNRERIGNFAKAIVTENRLEQGWEYLESKNASSLGTFLKWVSEDCFAEEKREMETLQMTKRNLNPAITVIAKPWFWTRLERAGIEEARV